MRKEFIKLTHQRFDENMNPIEEINETLKKELIADEGKVFHCKTTGFTGGVRITLSSDDNEDNYIEVDPK